MRINRHPIALLALLALTVCLFLPAGAEEADNFAVIRLAVVKLAKNASIDLRDAMTTGKDYTTTGHATKGEIVSVLTETGNWAYVRARDGEGYIMQKFLAPYSGTTLPPEATPAPSPTPEPEMPFVPTDYLNTRAAFPQEEGEAQKLLLSFIGDVTLGCNEVDHEKPQSITSFIGRYGYGYPFAKVSYVLAQDDLTIANLEGTFHSDSSGLTAQTKKAYNFRAMPALAEVLTGASIEAVALGNNHIIDYGEPGYLETVETLDRHGIEWFGNTDYGAKGCVIELDGARIGLVSCYISYWVINNGEHIPLINETIESVRGAGVDVLIAYMHGGVEYEPRHDDHQERLAKYFVSRGVDIVIGSHPHQLQGCQMIDGVPVFYSLGNFVFGGNFSFYHKRHHDYLRYTAILQCALSFDEQHRYLGVRFNIIPCRLGMKVETNEYQPFTVTGDEAVACIKDIQLDTNKFWRLNGYTPGVGAMQEFIPAKAR